MLWGVTPYSKAHDQAFRERLVRPLETVENYLANAPSSSASVSPSLISPPRPSSEEHTLPYLERPSVPNTRIPSAITKPLSTSPRSRTSSPVLNSQRQLSSTSPLRRSRSRKAEKPKAEPKPKAEKKKEEEEEEEPLVPLSPRRRTHSMTSRRATSTSRTGSVRILTLTQEERVAPSSGSMRSTYYLHIIGLSP
jgi:hypothetical protein